MRLAAISKNTPLFPSPLYVGLPVIEPEVRRVYHALMDEAFDRRYLTNNGPLLQRFENEIATLHNVKYCSAVCNATVAQILLMKALELKGEVIVPSFTFIATAHSCLWQDLDVVFCDISPDTLMIDPKKVENLITPQTCAVIGVHLFGNICDVESLTTICAHYGLRLIFDAAHAFNCSLGDIPVGSFGDGEFLSFHATKFLGTFEGGAILCRSEELDARVKLLRNFGFNGYDNVTHLGINGKMSEASAAFGLASLPMIDSRTSRLARVHNAYRKNLCNIRGIKMIYAGETGRSNYQYAVILVDEELFGVSRDLLNEVLWMENIYARRYFFPGCHQMQYCARGGKFRSGQLEVTESISQQVLCLPTNLDDPEADVEKIVSIFNEIHDHADEVNRWKESRSTY
ncbi:MAG: DegT/DnrJ/EryC1/StrS family aminotransferase [Syntrophales bacterium]